METRFIKETEMFFGNFDGKDVRQGFRENGNVAKNENRRFFGESKPVLYELQEKS